MLPAIQIFNYFRLNVIGYETADVGLVTKEPIYFWLRSSQYVFGYETANIFSVTKQPIFISGTKQPIYLRVRNSYETAERFLGTKRFGNEAAETSDLYFGYKTTNLFKGTKQPINFRVRNSRTFSGYETVRLRSSYFFSVTKRTGYETSL